MADKAGGAGAKRAGVLTGNLEPLIYIYTHVQVYMHTYIYVCMRFEYRGLLFNQPRLDSMTSRLVPFGVSLRPGPGPEAGDQVHSPHRDLGCQW